MSKIITEDTTNYKFKKIQFKELLNGQMFMDKKGKLFIKTSYCDVIDGYATSLSDGNYVMVTACEEVYPVDCEITFTRILQYDKED